MLRVLDWLRSLLSESKLTEDFISVTNGYDHLSQLLTTRLQAVETRLNYVEAQLEECRESHIRDARVIMVQETKIGDLEEKVKILERSNHT